MSRNATEQLAPSAGSMQFLLILVETDIKRDGEMASFMVRSGLLRDILKLAIDRVSAAPDTLADDIAWLRDRGFSSEKAGDDVTFERIASTLERLAQGIEAATAAETVELGSVHESPVGNADAPKGESR